MADLKKGAKSSVHHKAFVWSGLALLNTKIQCYVEYGMPGIFDDCDNSIGASSPAPPPHGSYRMGVFRGCIQSFVAWDRATSTPSFWLPYKKLTSSARILSHFHILSSRHPERSFFCFSARRTRRHVSPHVHLQY